MRCDQARTRKGWEKIGLEIPFADSNLNGYGEFFQGRAIFIVCQSENAPICFPLFPYRSWNTIRLSRTRCPGMDLPVRVAHTEPASDRRCSSCESEERYSAVMHQEKWWMAIV